MSITHIRPSGPAAFLVEVDSLPEVLALHAFLTAEDPAGLVDAVCAARTVLVRAASPAYARRIAALVAHADLTAPVDLDHTEVSVDVVYDGADLDEVAALTGMSRDAVIAAHIGQEWTAAFGGFAPGFVYCIGQDSSLNVPRRATPRTSVPAGSVGLAGHFSGVYPRSSPGGWQLIGHTGDQMWDPTRAQPALIAPGNRVRYRAVRHALTVRSLSPVPTTATAGLLVRRAGLQSLLEDDGRPGYAALGVTESGALDRAAAHRANRLVGNPVGAVVVESLMGGLTVTAQGDQVLAVTGAAAPVEVEQPDGAPGVRRYPVRRETPFALLDGATVSIGTPERGMRTYLAARGGFDAPTVLGSASRDLLSEEGPAPLAAGSVLAVRPAPWPSTVGAPAFAPPLPGSDVTVRVVLGPRDDWFTPQEVAAFLERAWTVTERSNRIGLRLDGRPVARLVTGELASEGTVAGSIQIPADGKPVLFLRDHPVTGGYPVIAVAAAEELDVLAQVVPGTRLHFVPLEKG